MREYGRGPYADRPFQGDTLDVQCRQASQFFNDCVHRGEYTANPCLDASVTATKAILRLLMGRMQLHRTDAFPHSFVLRTIATLDLRILPHLLWSAHALMNTQIGLRAATSAVQVWGDFKECADEQERDALVLAQPRTKTKSDGSAGSFGITSRRPALAVRSSLRSMAV